MDLDLMISESEDLNLDSGERGLELATMELDYISLVYSGDQESGMKLVLRM